jgi:hypothetical protein
MIPVTDAAGRDSPRCTAPVSGSSALELEHPLHASPPRRVRFALVLAIEAVLTLPFLVVRPFPSVDFHSHVYNAWLSHLIEGGELPGLSVAPAWTNAATDRVVAVLLPLLPLRAVETLVLIVLAHLVVWSGFLFCRALAGRGCWESLPVLAAVSLGWSFHMGFTNWLAAASLSLLAGTVVLSRLPIAGQVAMGLPIVTLAAISNPLPLAWIAAACRTSPGCRPSLARSRDGP